MRSECRGVAWSPLLEGLDRILSALRPRLDDNSVLGYSFQVILDK
jgi:hypothetical protein